MIEMKAVIFGVPQETVPRTLYFLLFLTATFCMEMFNSVTCQQLKLVECNRRWQDDIPSSKTFHP